MEINLENLLLKAKIEIMTRSVFLSTIILSVRHNISEDIPTAATDGLCIMYNPNFISKLTHFQMAGLMAHEAWHIAFQHLLRRGGRDAYIWNIAGDYIINFLVLRDGFELPEGGAVSDKYDDKWSTDAIYDDIFDNAEQITLTLQDIMGEPGEASGLTKGELTSEVTDVLSRAHTQSTMAGKSKGEIPGEIERVIERLLNPVIPWEVLLYRWLDRKVREEYTWNRRNRRFSHAYLPSMQNLGLGKLTFAVDTSGSQDDREVAQILTELHAVQKTFCPEEMIIIDCDARIHHVHEIGPDTDILSLKFTGNGGTRFKPVLDYVTEHPTQALIYFTDLYGEIELPEVDYPVLWICNSKHAPATIGETIYVDP